MEVRSQKSKVKSLLALMLIVALGAPGARGALEWLKPHKDGSNNAYHSEIIVPIDLAAAADWTTGARDLDPRGGVAIHRGAAYAMAHHGATTVTLAAFNLANGARLWETAALDLGVTIAFESNSSPALDPDERAVYAVAGQSVYKFDALNGRELWSTRLDETNTSPTVTSYQIVNSSPALGDGLVFIETYGGFTPANKQTVALDAGDGHVVWFRNEKGVGTGTPCYVDEGGVKRLFTSVGNGIVCYEPAGGTPLWHHAGAPVAWSFANTKLQSSIVYADGKVYMTANDFGATGELVCADAATGSKAWLLDDVPASSVAPVVMGEKVYVQGGAFGNPARLAAYSTSDGGRAFNVATGGSSYNTDMAATAERIYMSDGQNLLAIDPASGAVLEMRAGGSSKHFDGPVTIDGCGAMYVHYGDALVALARPESSPGVWPATPFRAPIEFTTQDEPVARRRLARNPRGTLIWGPDGLLRLTYWEGVENPSSIDPDPNRVWLREWDPLGGWGAPERVDLGAAAPDLGGRHPTLALRARSEWWAAWHDPRHATEAGGYIDNLEIYANRKRVGETFPTSPFRLTQSDAGGFGDNGYLARIAALCDGRMAVAWYDFFWTPSEIAIRVSDASGDFDNPAMNTITATTLGYRESGDAEASFTVPDLALDTSDTIHLVWAATDFEGNSNNRNLYYGRLDPDSGQWLERRRLRSAAGGFFDPAKAIADPYTGDVWIVFTDHAGGQDEIYAQRRRAGAADFDAAIRLTNDGANQLHPDALLDKAGRLHVVYVDESAPGTRVRTMIYDPKQAGVVYQANLSEALTPDPFPTWERPTLAHDDRGYVYCVWEKVLGDTAGELYFTTNRPGNAAGDWERYE